MEKITCEKFLDEINVQYPKNDLIKELGRKIGLFENDGKVIEVNFNRGALLYALISKYKPKHVLEFGTGGGFSTMFMAWAMVDNDIDGTIFSIDQFDSKESLKRPIDWNDGNGIVMETISNVELWKKAVPAKWLSKIKILTGYSSQIMTKEKFPKIDFAYIDGAHFYEGVKYDFYSFLKNSNKDFRVLFDDYIDRPWYGVKKLIDGEVSKLFDVKLIETDNEHYFYKNGITNDINYGMCLIDSDTLKVSKNEIIDSKIEEELKNYLKFEKRLRLRNSLNKKVPFLKNHRLKWWKKSN